MNRYISLVGVLLLGIVGAVRVFPYTIKYPTTSNILLSLGIAVCMIFGMMMFMNNNKTKSATKINGQRYRPVD